LRKVIHKTVLKWINEGWPLLNAKQISKAVKAEMDCKVSIKVVRKVLKNELGFRFLKTKKLHPQANSVKVLVQRQQYAITLLRLMELGRRVINIDETWINETSFDRKVWAKKGGEGNLHLRAVTPRLSLIAALDTDGKVWFSLAHATTNSDVIALFLHQLVRALDSE
jgi:hypothetical protein